MKVRFLRLSRVRISALFLFIAFFLYQNSIFAEDKRLENTLLAQEITLIEAIHHISEQYQVLFNYDRKIVSDIKVQYEPEQFENVDAAIASILKETNLKYQIFSHRYVVIYKNDEEGIESLKEMIQHFQTIVDDREDIVLERQRLRPSPKLIRTLPQDVLRDRALTFSIAGVVTDQDGEPLIGVNIQVKGTNMGTSTDIDGQFTLDDIDENAVLVVSYIGYQTQEVPVAGKSNLSIILISDSQLLDEVVVVGYGKTSDRKLTTSVSTIGSKEIENIATDNLGSTFTGNMTGVYVEDASGAPNSNPVLRIRGFGSINAGSEPLYVIDEMIVTSQEFKLLNPKSVQSISILKDAAAGAIYGSRAANGVVIVTTKEGRGEPHIILNSSVGLQHVEKQVEVLNGKEFIEFTREAYENDGLTPPDLNHPDYTSTNWQDEIFKIAHYENHRLTTMGGNDNLTYNFSLNYMNNQGTIITTYQKTYSTNGKFNFKVNDKFTTGLSFNAAYIKSRINDRLGEKASSLDGGGVLEKTFSQYPLIPVYMENGDYGQVDSRDWGDPVVYGQFGNPVAALREYHFNKSYFNLIGRVFMAYQATNNLKLEASLDGVLNTDLSSKFITPYLSDRIYHAANFSNPIYRRMQASQSNSLANGYTFNGLANYNRQFDRNHNFDIVAGASYQFYGNKGVNIGSTINDRGANAANPLPTFSNDTRPNIFGANDLIGNGIFSEYTFVSIFGRMNYDFKDRYLVGLSIRQDGSSKFAPNFRYGIFPAVSFGWRVSDESFLRFDNIEDLKFRVSYGVSGNDQIGDYLWQGNINYGNSIYIYGPADISDGVALTSFPQSIENRNLKWETNKQFNIGMDLTSKNGRIGLTSDFYVRKTSDMLLSQPVPAENGIASTVLRNIGEIRNIGFELMINSANVISRKFSWSTMLTFNKISNKILKLNVPGGIIRLGLGSYTPIWLIEGEEMFKIYTYKVNGVFSDEDELSQYPSLNNSRIGDPIIDDYNKDGIINEHDLQYTGKALPDFTLGLRNNFTYSDFDFSFILDASYGGAKVSHNFKESVFLVPLEGNQTKYVYDRRNELFGAPTLDYTGMRFGNLSYMVFDASYLRIKNISLGYSFPNNVLNTNLRLSFNIQNLYTFTSYPWYNPQANYYEGQKGTAQFGVDNGTYPLATKYVLGVTLTF